MRKGFAYSAVLLVCAAIIFHLFKNEPTADVLGALAFLLLFGGALAPDRLVPARACPDSACDQETYDSLHADPSNQNSFEVLSKVDLLLELARRAKVDFRGQKVCDVGFGSGQILDALVQSKAAVSGVELSEFAVRAARDRSPGMDLRRESAERTSFRDNVFDYVVCSHVIEHLFDEGAVLKELRRILRQDGALIVGVPGTGSEADPRHYRVYSNASLHQALSTHGFAPMCTIMAGSRLVSWLTPKRRILDSSASARFVVAGIRRAYQRFLTPLLRSLYSASVRSEELGPVNEIWSLARRADP